jgi:superfamily II DNA or RNA helicase
MSFRDPEVRPGALVNLRRRLWRVEEISGEVLTATSVDDFMSQPQRFLLSVEQIEAGIIAPPELSELGNDTLQRLFLQAVRLDALHGTAPFMCLQRVGIIPTEYQLVPLVMALRQARTRLLIADTTGLGKTIEAGLIAKELMARGRARSILVITPSNLREQWRQQLRDLFYLDCEIMSADTRRRLERAIPPGADAWTYFDKLIISIDYAKDSRNWPQLTKRRWDVVIIDEAHNTALPHTNNNRQVDMERHKVAQRLADTCDHLLLLSATPHNGYTDSFCSLLNMLSPRLVKGVGSEIKPQREVAKNYVCQRTRVDVQNWFKGSGKSFPFPDREPESETEVAVTLDKAYIKILSELEDALDFVVSATKLTSNAQQPIEWMRLHFHRRALSSPMALQRSLENRLAKLKSPPRIEEEAEQLSLTQELKDSLADTTSDDAISEEEADRRADSALLRFDLQAQLKSFEPLLEKVRGFSARKDKKLTSLRDDVIPSLFAKADERTPARVIIFTRYKDTLNYLEKELNRSADYPIITMHGDLSEAKREEQLDAFMVGQKAVLLATDVISEGLNLQGMSCMVVNYDIPWNPNRLEQRIGRVDRFGQNAPVVYIRTLYCRDTTDEFVMQLLIRKLDTIRRDLGACPPFFASEDTVQRLVLLRKAKRGRQAENLTGSLFAQDELDFTEFDRQMDQAFSTIRGDGFYGQAEVNVTDVAGRLQAAYSRYGTPKSIQFFIEEGLRRYGSSVQSIGNELFRVTITNPRLQIKGLKTTLNPVVFDPSLRSLHPEATVLDVGHPLVRRLNVIIREDALKDGAQGARTTAFIAQDQRGTSLLGHGLLRAIAKTTPTTLLEEVVTFGVNSSLTGMKIMSEDEVELANKSKPLAGATVSREDSIARIQTMEQKTGWQEARDGALQGAVIRLRNHRTELKNQLTHREQLDSEWLQGFDDIEVVGFDLYCLTLILPPPR